MNQISNSTSIIKAFLAAENKRDWETWSSYIHSDIEHEVVGNENFIKGKEAYSAKMKKIYSELSDWHFDILNILGHENIVIVEFDGKGHFTGVHENKKYSQVPIHIKAVCVFSLENGKIRKIREFWDPVGYKRQLKLKTDHRVLRNIVKKE